jgi:hypothetical protein
MNIYRYGFSAICPNNGERIYYRLVVTTDFMVPVEVIKSACGCHPSAYHEQIADALAVELGGEQVITAVHHGVEIETRRGWQRRVPATIAALPPP